MNENNGIPHSPFVGWPLRHLLFVSLRDGGNSPANLAQDVADGHGITVEELKAHCRRTGEEWQAREGGLTEQSQRVYEWAKRQM